MFNVTDSHNFKIIKNEAFSLSKEIIKHLNNTFCDVFKKFSTFFKFYVFNVMIFISKSYVVICDSQKNSFADSA